MKWGLLLILCILISSIYVSADDEVILNLGESYVKDSVNITFAKIDKEYEKVVLCVNNEKQILNDDQLTYFTNASLKVVDIDRYNKTLKMRVDWIKGCVGCKCKGACLNSQCRIAINDEFGESLEENKSEEKNDTVENNTIVKNVDVVKHEKLNYGLIVGLGVIGGLIGIFLVWLFWFREMTF